LSAVKLSIAPSLELKHRTEVSFKETFSPINRTISGIETLQTANRLFHNVLLSIAPSLELKPDKSSLHQKKESNLSIAPSLELKHEIHSCL